MSGEAPRLDADFSLYCHSLGTQALYWLGLVADPDSGETAMDLTKAKALIDTLEMLSVKTKGNLTADEQKHLSSLLFDVRLRYVERSKATRTR